MKKVTTLLVQYGFEIKKGNLLLANGSGHGSMQFAYANNKEYVENYGIASSKFLDDTKKDFCRQSSTPSNENINSVFTFFTCVHSMTEELFE